ncbi:MAG: hypothetical protein IJL78_11050 [Lachnospiraceae bacterium]|nr:hypothetical protein [Lachnospiraceae bacterium]
MKNRLFTMLLVLVLFFGIPAQAWVVYAEESDDETLSQTLDGTDTASLPEVGELVNGFEALEIRDFPAINASVVRFVHEKTGAVLYYIANDDINRVFDLTFRTKAPDDPLTIEGTVYSEMMGKRSVERSSYLNECGQLIDFSWNDQAELITALSLRDDHFQGYQGHQIRVFDGKCQALFRALPGDQELVVRAESEGLARQVSASARPGLKSRQSLRRTSALLTAGSCPPSSRRH